MAGSGSGPEQPTPAELLKYGDLCEVSYDNFKSTADKKLPFAMRSMTSKIMKDMDSSPAGAASVAEPPGRAGPTGWDLVLSGFQSLIPLGHNCGSHVYFISADEAAKHGKQAGMPIWQPDLAQQYWGYKDLWSFSGHDNLTAKILCQGLPSRDPTWAGYMAYRKPAEGNAADRGELVIVFRGTQLKSEWLSDAVAGVTGLQQPEDYDSTRPEMGKVHKGFYHIYAARSELASSHGNVPKQEVEEALQAAKDRQGPFNDQPFPRVTTVGHSLGGALAALCALHVADWLERHNVPVSKEDVIAYTYDAPCIGNKALAEQINKRVTIWRVVNKHDIVPRVPPTGTEDVDVIRQRLINEFGLDWLKRKLLNLVLGAIRNRDWHHGGVLLEYDPIELGHQLGKDSPYDPNRKWGIGDHHNLQLLLYVIAQKAKLPRDPTLINKGTDILKHDPTLINKGTDILNQASKRRGDQLADEPASKESEKKKKQRTTK